MRIAHEARAQERQDQGGDVDVEGDVRGREEEAGVGGGEADVGDGVFREVRAAEREVFELPRRSQYVGSRNEHGNVPPSSRGEVVCSKIFEDWEPRKILLWR